MTRRIGLTSMRAMAAMTMTESREITARIIAATTATIMDIAIAIMTTIGATTWGGISTAAVEAYQSAALFSITSGTSRK